MYINNIKRRICAQIIRGEQIENGDGPFVLSQQHDNDHLESHIAYYILLFQFGRYIIFI